MSDLGQYKLLRISQDLNQLTQHQWIKIQKIAVLVRRG